MNTYTPMHAMPPPGAVPPQRDADLSTRERIARAKTIAKRAAGHWRMASLLLFVGCALAVLAAWNSPRAYRSECIVQFKAGLRMGDKDDDSPADRASRLAPRLKDELTTRARLESVIKEFSLYPKIVESRGMSEAVDEMRDKYVGFRGKGDSSTFVISFESDSPELAQKVTQRLADTMIEQYTKGNLSAVSAQEEFLAKEEARSEAELEAANKAFAQFLAAHPEFAQEMKRSGGSVGAVGGGGGAQIVMPQQVNSGDPQLEALKRQRARIEAEIKAVQTGAPAPLVGTPAQEARLAKARRDRDDAQKAVDDATARLASLRAQGLKDDWPDVRAAQSELARSKAQLAGADATVRDAEQDIRLADSPVPNGKIDVDELQNRLGAIDAQIAAVRAGRSGKQAAALDAGAKAEPVSEIVELETDWQRLLRTLQESKENHDDLKQKLERARLEKSRAQGNSGDTMSILDPAYKPTKPSRGGKTKVALSGGVLALVVALFYAFGRVVFNDTMIDAQDIEALKLIPVLGTLPRISGAGVYASSTTYPAGEHRSPPANMGPAAYPASGGHGTHPASGGHGLHKPKGSPPGAV